MSDYLLARDGLGKVVEYYRLFGQRQNRFGNFRHAFGQNLDEFEREVLRYLAVSATLTGVRGMLGPPLGATIIHVAGVRAVYLVAAGTMISAVWRLHRQVRVLTSSALPSYRTVPSSSNAC